MKTPSACSYYPAHADGGCGPGSRSAPILERHRAEAVPSLPLSKRLQRKARRISFRPRSASPCSTMTARCGRAADVFPARLRARSREGARSAASRVEGQGTVQIGPCSGDLKALGSWRRAGLLEIVLATHAGNTTEEFEQVVRDWIATAKHPQDGPPLQGDGLPTDARAARLPAGERLQDLHRLRRRHRVHAGVGRRRLWHSSGAGHRQQRQDAASSCATASPCCEACRRSTSSTTRQASPSPSTSSSAAARSLAFGNSDGDLQMLRWTAAGAGPRFCLYIHHTDAEREFAYDRESAFGRLDKGLEEARSKGWTIVDMENDWVEIFPPTP